MLRSPDFALRAQLVGTGRLDRGLITGLLVGAGVGIGLVASALPSAASLALTAVLLLAVALVIVWKLLRFGPSPRWLGRRSDQLAAQTEQARVGSSLRPDRALFFLGAALVIETAWRVGPTISDLCFLGAFAWCCFNLIRGRATQKLPTLIMVGACLFAVGGFVSAIGSQAPGRSLYETTRGIWVLALWPWTASNVLRGRGDLRIVLGMWLLSGAIDGFAALGQTTGLSSIAGPLAGSRATGFGGEPNGLGGAACTLLVPALAMALKFPARSRLLRGAQWITFLVTGSALVTSGSVSALAGGVLSLFVWMLFPSVRRSIRTAVLVCLAAGLVLSSALAGSNSGSSPVHRVQQVFAPASTSGTTGSAHDHLATIRHAWPRIREDPVVGVGLDNSTTLVHSGVVATWLGAGLFGLMGLLLMVGGALSLGWYAVRAATDEADSVMIWALMSGVVGFGVFFSNQPLFFNQYGFFAVALLVAWSVHTIPAVVVSPAQERFGRRLQVAPG